MIHKFSERNKIIAADILLLLTGVIWGTGFIAQRSGMNYLGPFLFSGLRFLLGSLVLAPILFFTREEAHNKSSSTAYNLKAGLISGLILFAGVSFQQNGLITTSAGKGGFLTSLYIIFVPFISIFLKEKPKAVHFVGALLALLGVYLLSMSTSLIINKGDILVILCAVAFAVHILVLSHFVKRVNPVVLSLIQFFFCGVFSLITALFTENLEIALIIKAWIPLVYGAIFPISVGYTLQVIAQKYAPAPHASILLGTESLFAVIFGWLLLNEHLTGRGTLGCALIFSAVVVTQLGFTKIRAIEQ